MSRKQLLISTALIALVAVVLLVIPDQPKASYHANKGYVFGTYYAIQYESVSDLHDSIKEAFAAFDGSMSMFNPQSTISRINAGADSVVDDCFVQMYRTAVDVNRLSDGAFDITVAPLVNLWGFGLKNRAHVTQEQVDSLLPHVGMHKIELQAVYLHKYDPCVQIDAGAIAKGQSCDVIAAYLHTLGVRDMLVNIGEIYLEGLNPRGEGWTVGVDTPYDGNDTPGASLSGVWQSDGGPFGVVTSGNYRKFYVHEGRKYAHTIDPRSGFPVPHALLSATVTVRGTPEARSAALSDALATWCMVAGECPVDEEGVEALLITADSLHTTPGFSLIGR